MPAVDGHCGEMQRSSVRESTCAGVRSITPPPVTGSVPENAHAYLQGKPIPSIPRVVSRAELSWWFTKFECETRKERTIPFLAPTIKVADASGLFR